MQPTPIFFLSAIPTVIACSLSEILGNIAKVNSSGKNQNMMPKRIIITPLNASVNLEFLIFPLCLCIYDIFVEFSENTVFSLILQKTDAYIVSETDTTSISFDNIICLNLPSCGFLCSHLVNFLFKND